NSPRCKPQLPAYCWPPKRRGFAVDVVGPRPISPHVFSDARNSFSPISRCHFAGHNRLDAKRHFQREAIMAVVEARSDSKCASLAAGWTSRGIVGGNELVGLPVVDSRAEHIGVLADIMLDLRTGRIAYGVVVL